MHEIDLSNFSLRTDLIIENKEVNHNEETINGITITKSNQDGNYFTISFEDITNFETRENIGKELEKIIKEILKLNQIKEDASCLYIGLGNRLSTPDSLGPKVVDNLLVTAHLYSLGNIKEGIRKTYSFNPGVMASTGIESSKIISALIKEIKPDFIIAIDALASLSVDRINKTIQITDTGIHPGSGVGNNRLEISKNTQGIPVIAIGVPTVTTSSSIVYDAIKYLYKHISYIKNNSSTNKLSYYKKNYKNKLEKEELSEEDKSTLLGLFGSLEDIEQKNLINEVLNNTNLNLIVTPTEIDFLIDKLSSVISGSINNALSRQINHF